MVGVKERAAVREGVFSAVGEREVARAQVQAAEKRLVTDPAQGEINPDGRQETNLPAQERPTVREFPGGGLVLGRGAPGRRGDPDPPEPESVPRMLGNRPGGEPDLVKRAIEPGARGVEGEHPPGLVRAMDARGEADQDEPGLGVAPAGDGFGAVVGPTGPGFSQVSTEPGALAAVGNRL